MDRNRRNSAVEILFSTEMERFRPEEREPVALQQSKSSASFPGCSYSDLLRNESHQQIQRRPVSCYEESNQFGENRKSSSEGSMREGLPSSPRTYYTDTGPNPCFTRHYMRKGLPNSYCYNDGITQLPAQASAVVEEIMRLTNQSKLFPGPPADRSPSARRLTEYHQPVYPRTSCKGSASVVNQTDVQTTNMEDSQDPYPKRSLSHSDMKSEGFPRGSEFRPLGPYPFLTRTSSVSRNPLPHKLIALPLPPPPPPPTLVPSASSSSKKGPQMTERYVYSGTESSDSESEIINPYYYAVFGKNISHPMARVRLSSGSLQLDDEEEFPLNVPAWGSRKPKSERKHYYT